MILVAESKLAPIFLMQILPNIKSSPTIAEEDFTI